MSNTYWPYYLGNTLNFTYNGKNVWGTIIKFGKDFVTCITKDGYRSYKWNKMSTPLLYQCAINELVRLYQHYGDNNFEYLYNYYGPWKPSVQWSQD